MNGKIKKSVIMYCSFGEKSVNFNSEYKGLPEQVIKELAALLSKLSERIKGSVQLGVINDSRTIIETFSEADKNATEYDSVNTNTEVDEFIRDNETLLDAVGKFHYLYFTPEGAEFRKLLSADKK